MVTSVDTTSGNEQLSIFSLAGLRAQDSRWQDFAKVWLMTDPTSPSLSLELLIASSRNGSFGRTSPERCHKTKDGRLAPSSGGWQSAGIIAPTGQLTLSSALWTEHPPQFRRDASVCSLSAIVVTGAVPPQYFLTPRASRGILHRAGKRAMKTNRVIADLIPPALLRALEIVAKVAMWLLITLSTLALI